MPYAGLKTMKTGSIRTTEAPSRVFSTVALNITIIALLALFCAGCTHVSQTRSKTSAQLDEHSRSLTTAVVDTLHLQPTERRDEFTDTALRLAREDQRIEGLPLASVPIADLIGFADTNLSPAEIAAQQTRAKENLAKQFAEIRELLGTERRAQDRLVAFGQRFEQERNERRVSLFKRWSTTALVLGGLVALAVFCPAAIPLLGRLLAWGVARFPALAGTAGQRESIRCARKSN